MGDANKELATIVLELNYALGPFGKGSGPNSLFLGALVFILIGYSYEGAWAWPVGISGAIYMSCFIVLTLYQFASVGDSYHHASKQLTSDTKFISAVFEACTREGHAGAVLEGIKDADVAFRFLGVVSLDYHIVTRMMGSMLVAIAFVVIPKLLMGGD